MKAVETENNLDVKQVLPTVKEHFNLITLLIGKRDCSCQEVGWLSEPSADWRESFQRPGRFLVDHRTLSYK